MPIRILLIACEVISINKSSCVLQRSHLSHKSHQTSAGMLSDAPLGAHAGILLYKHKFFQQSIKHTTFQYTVSVQKLIRIKAMSEFCLSHYLIIQSGICCIISNKLHYSAVFFKSTSFPQLSLLYMLALGLMHDMMIQR